MLPFSSYLTESNKKKKKEGKKKLILYKNIFTDAGSFFF